MRLAPVLNTQVQVERLTLVSDGMGGFTEEWTVVATVPARISQPSADMQEAAASESAVLDHNVYLLPDADVARGDRLRHTMRGAMDVNAVVIPSRPVYARAECTLRQEASQ